MEADLDDVVVAVCREAVGAEGVAGAAEAEEVALVLAKLRVQPARHEEARAKQRPQPWRTQVLLRPHHRTRARHAHHHLSTNKTQQSQTISSDPNQMHMYTATLDFTSPSYHEHRSAHPVQHTHASIYGKQTHPSMDQRKEQFLPLVEGPPELQLMKFSSLNILKLQLGATTN